MLFWYLVINFVVIHGIYQCGDDETSPTYPFLCYFVWNAGDCDLPAHTGYCCNSCPDACKSQCLNQCDVDFRVPSPLENGYTHSCDNQVEWEKCGELWMKGHCCKSCNEACGCNQFECNSDIPPSIKYSCIEQKDWSQCGQAWMDGYCCTSCPQACQPIC